MRFGYVSMNSASGIRPDVVARELEERGFDSLWVPQHSHIPTSRLSPFPNGGDLPSGYLHMMDPLVSLTAAALATTDLVVATGVCLLLEADLLDLACRTATLDVLSGGRLLLGVGVGWNREELENHRPDVPFAKRYAAMRERVEALRTIWREDEPSFSGTWDDFTTSWVYPKPTRGYVPIALGNSLPLGIRHAARYADHWSPIDAHLVNEKGEPDVVGGVAWFRSLVAEYGRDPDSVPVTLWMFRRPEPRRLERYVPLGLERIVLSGASAVLEDEAATMRTLDELSPVVSSWR
ncbi:MAG: TIGR03619 family F420-dependent LLM class oxidoreductase [Acidimicrobiia bacterium]|nr:TIGR03619 family F420-dependent LLM class oxidoreductase [Acidimicrobiia bacterium]